jgi:HK97 family phage prohead protease
LNIHNYEIAANRDYEIAGGGGWIQSVDGRSMVPPIFAELPTSTKAAESCDDETVLIGYALLWNKIVEHDGKYILVRPNAFKDLQCGEGRFFLHNHDTSIQVASTKNNLALHADDVGLAFKLFIPNTALGKYTRHLVLANEKSAMSASFVGTDVEKRIVDGVEIHIVTKGQLFEISLVRAGACHPAFAVLVKKDSCRSLSEDCESGRMKSELHATAMMRAMRTLMNNLS